MIAAVNTTWSGTLVVNKKLVQPQDGDVYIGRPSKWGNPFTHIADRRTLAKFVVATRQESIDKYKVSRPDLMNALHELKGRRLVCWCKPLPCHLGRTR